MDVWRPRHHLHARRGRPPRTGPTPSRGPPSRSLCRAVARRAARQLACGHRDREAAPVLPGRRGRARDRGRVVRVTQPKARTAGRQPPCWPEQQGLRPPSARQERSGGCRPEASERKRCSLVTSPESLLAKIGGKNYCVGIIGLGYVGLPLARAFAAARLPGAGLRHRPGARSSSSQRGESYIGHIPPRRVARDARPAASRPPTDFDRLDEPDAIIICVPTPLTEAREPDLTYIVNSARAVAARAAAGPARRAGKHHLSRAPPARSCCRSWRRAACRPGKDFFLAFSPEREDPGNPTYSTPTIPKVVGGLDPASLRLAAALYGQVVVARRAGLQPRGGRGVQDPGEHLPRGQHRPGQRAEDALRPHGHRRLGSDRGGQDQAVRLPGVLSRPGPGRALHPHRPVLPDLEGPASTA